MTTKPFSAPAASTPRDGPYSRLRQGLHWGSAAGILAMYPTGFLMARKIDDAQRLTLYQVHVLTGWLIVALMLTRLVLRVRRPIAPPPGLALWNRRLHTTVHWLATVLPFALALSGVGALLQNDLFAALQSLTPPPETLDVVQSRDAHMIGAYVYLALLAVHVAGVVRYQTTKGDVLGRMGIRGLPANRR